MEIVMISQKAKYAFKALIVLARRSGRTVQIEEIAREDAIPRKFLEQILVELKHAGLIASRRGPTGGYTLIKEPKEISIGQVLRIVDGPIAPLPCLSRTAYRRCLDCRDETNCGVRRLFAETFAATLRLMETATLSEALTGEGTLGRALAENAEPVG
jgi:Rrf2 family protein